MRGTIRECQEASAAATLACVAWDLLVKIEEMGKVPTELTERARNLAEDLRRLCQRLSEHEETMFKRGKARRGR